MSESAVFAVLCLSEDRIYRGPFQIVKPNLRSALQGDLDEKTVDGQNVFPGIRLPLTLFSSRPNRHRHLEFFSKEFKKDITDERGEHRNFKIGSGKNISDSPG